MRTLVLTFMFPLFFLFLSNTTIACVDSIWHKVEPVQCYGLRNGKIMVTQVFGGTQPYYYSIDGISYSTNPTFDRLWAGDYLLSIRDASGCITTIALKVNEPQEMTARILAADSSVVAGTSFLLHAIYAPETIVLQSIHWEPAELFPKQDTLRQQISISRSTDFSVELTDDHGCSARAERGMGVKKPNLYFPNALKLGSENDAYFTVFAGEGVESILYLRIYNRVGAAIFERFNFQPNEPAKGWNGRWAEKDVQPGVYIWAVSIKYLDGTVELREGTVTVLE